MIKNHFISVIIPNYNYAHYVGDAIDSVMAQTYKKFELIVIDNGSTDNSRETLEEYKKKYSPQIRVIFQENKGQAGARNRGIKESNGDLIALLDADDVWCPNKLQEQIRLFNKNEVGLVYSNYYIVDKKLNIIKEKKMKYRGKTLHHFAISGALTVVDGGESNAIIRKECFARVGYFDSDLEESTGWDMYRRVASLYEIDYVNKPLMLYRVHGENLHQTNRKLLYKQLEKHINKMFEDPLSNKIQHLRKRGYSQMYLDLANHHRKSNYFKMFYCLVLSLLYHPEQMVSSSYKKIKNYVSNGSSVLIS